MKLFIAVKFTEELEKTVLFGIEQLKKQSISGNFTKRENLHLTLAFIGETDNIEDVKKSMDQADYSSFNLTVCGFGNFGNLYWAGIEKNTVLSAYACHLQGILRKNGFNIEEREFKPHVTLARNVEIKKPIQLNIPRAGMTVNSVFLLKSEIINGKRVYTEIYEKHLK